MYFIRTVLIQFLNSFRFRLIIHNNRSNAAVSGKCQFFRCLIVSMEEYL